MKAGNTLSYNNGIALTKLANGTLKPQDVLKPLKLGSELRKQANQAEKEYIQNNQISMKAKLESLDLTGNNIYTKQGWLDNTYLNSIMKSGYKKMGYVTDYPSVVKFNGNKFLVIDGTHRIISAILSGKKSIKAEIMEVNLP